MSDNKIKTMLECWQQNSAIAQEQISTEIPINTNDLIKIKALAEVYHLQLNDLVANLLNTALKEVEEQMPYIAGKKVIRTEEGEPIYEDIGPTPAYLAAQERLSRKN